MTINGLKLLLKTVVVCVLLIIAYILGALTATKKTIPTPNTASKTEANNNAKFLTKDELLNTSGIIYEGITEEEGGPYITTLRKFEFLNKNNDANGVLEMFSPPISNSEKEELAFLEGTDSNTVRPILRLFGVNQLSYKLNWYLLKSVIRLGDTVSINLLESRTGYIPTGTPETNKDLYFSNQEYVILEIGKDLKIEKFHYPKTDGGSDGKYGGFYSPS